jgi:hypothetical protein
MGRFSESTSCVIRIDILDARGPARVVFPALDQIAPGVVALSSYGPTVTVRNNYTLYGAHEALARDICLAVSSGPRKLKGEETQSLVLPPCRKDYGKHQ